MNVWPFALVLWLAKAQEDYNKTGEIQNLGTTPVGQVASSISLLVLSPAVLTPLVALAMLVGFYVGVKRQRGKTSENLDSIAQRGSAR